MTPVNRKNSWLPDVFNDFFDTDFMPRTSATAPLDSKREMPTSTAFSALKRLSKQGYVIKNKKYEIDDPFFARWIFNRSL